MGAGESGAVQGATTGASAGAAFGPWGALIGGVVGAGAGWWLGNQSARAKRAASDEQIRRMDLEHAQVLGTGRANAAASGVETNEGDSFSKYLADMSNEFRRQHDWAVGQASRGESIEATTNAIQGLTGLGSSLFKFGDANKWWAPKTKATDRSGTPT